MTPQDLIAAFDVLAEAPNAADRLRELILQLAVRGKLVQQDPSDEPAIELLARLAAERARLIAEKQIPRQSDQPDVTAEEKWMQLPAGWAWTRLLYLGDWGAGATPRKGETRYYGGAHNWFKSGELPDGPMNQPSAERVTDAALDECSLRENKPGDVLIAMYGATIGKLGLLDVPGTTNQAVCACTCFLDFYNRYLFLFLRAWRAEFIGRGEGGAQPNISKIKIVSTQVPVPPLAEQKRIVARVDELMGLLDSLEAARDARETTRMALRDSALAALQQADTPEEVETAWQRIAENIHDLFTNPADIEPLRQTVLQLAVRGRLVPQDPNDEPATAALVRLAAEKARLAKEGAIRKQVNLQPIADDQLPFETPDSWVWVRPDEVSSCDRHALAIGPFGSNLLKADYRDSGVPLVFVREIRAELFGDDKTKFIEPGKAAELQAHMVNPGELLVTKMGAPPGDTAIYPADRPSAVITADCIRFAVDPLVGKVEWFKFMYRAPAVREMILDITMGIAHQKISLKRFRATPIPLPPLQEQRRILNRLAELLGVIQRLDNHLVTQDHIHDAFAAAAVHHLET
jgi:type I restriction enzyme S subunit